MRVRAFLWVLAGCGRIDFATATDGGKATVDASDDALCTWSPPVRVPDLASATIDADASYGPISQRIVFSSDRNGGLDLFTAVRTGTSWSPVTEVAAISTTARDESPAWNADETRLYFASYRSGPLRVYQSAVTNQTFGPPEIVPGFEDVSESLAPTLRRDELEMFLSNRLPPHRIERATRSSTAAPWVYEGPVAELAGEELGYPSLSVDGLTLYFERGTGGADVHIARARRAALDQPFGTIENVTPLNADGTDGDPSVAADGQTLWLTSNRAPQGNYDLYVSDRRCP